MKPIFDPGRPIGRLFYCLISIVIAVLASHANPPNTTTVSDIVYRADGSPAGGTLLISWPEFTSADGKAVAAASMSLTIGTGGSVTVALVPNAGATPAGTFYRVVYKLDDGTTSTEYWSVPSTSPTTIAAIRSTVVPASVAAQFVTKTYVDTQVATKATDAAVVHLAGTESVTGVKQFSASPSVPTPANAGDVTNKSYVDGLTYSGIGLCATDQYVFGINNHSAPSCRGIGNQRFADQFPSIQLAITDAGTAGTVLIPNGYTGTDAYTNPNNIQIDDKRGKPDRQKGFINVVTDCGAVGDGVTDDGPKINTCLANNPGRHIFFPYTGHSGSGGSASGATLSYYSSVPLVMVGNGQWLDGEVPGQNVGGGSPDILFAAGIAGIQVPSSVESAKISNLQLDGPSSQCWLSNSLTTFTFPASQTGPGGDGIQLGGGSPEVKNVYIECFARHGIYISGDSTIWASPPSQPDFWRMENILVNANHGSGIYVSGSDSNAGVGERIDARSNSLWGVDDESGLGNNVWTGIGTHSNHRDAILAGSTQAISTISVASNVATITTGAANSFVVNTWVTSSGSVDTTLNGTCQVSVVTDSTHFQCPFTHANASTTGGIVGTASSAAVYAYETSIGNDGGPIKSRGGSSVSVFMGSYCEANQPSNKIQGPALSIGGNCNIIETNFLAPNIYADINGLNIVGGSGTGFSNKRDLQYFLSVGAGSTADQTKGLELLDRNGSVQGAWTASGAGTIDITSNPNGAGMEITADGKVLLSPNNSNGVSFNGYGANHAAVLPGDNFYAGKLSAPALTFNTTGSHYGHIYNGNAANVIKFGFSGSISTNPSTAIVSITEAGNTTFANPVQSPGFGTGTSSNTDSVGQLTLAGGSATYSFTGAYTSAPICTANDTTALANVKPVATTTTLTLTGTGTDVINYHCFFRN